MITEIAVKNFKTLRDVRIPLAPGITVLVGANNSGKSNALAVLKLLAEAQREQSFPAAVQAFGGWESVRTRGVVRGLNISLHLEREGERFCLTAEDIPERGPIPPWGWRLVGPSRRLSADEKERLGEILVHSSVHDLSVAALRAPAIVQRGARMGPDGRDVAAVLDDLAGENPTLRDAIDQVVRGAAREVRRVVTRPGAVPGTKVLGIEEQDGRVYGAEDVSDGLLLFIGLAVAAQLKAGRPGILAIEEPERGIHPRRIREVLDHLRRLTQNGTQVVLTTHSPTLLDEFRDTPESVLIFDRDEQGTHITRLSDRPDWVEELQSGMPLGDLWYSGVLGGVPGR